jgi:hypothetical protein
VQLAVSARTGLPAAPGDSDTLLESFLASQLPVGARLPVEGATPGAASAPAQRGTDTTDAGESIF